MRIDLNGNLSVKEIRRYLFPKNSDTEHVIFLFAEYTPKAFIVREYRVLYHTDFDIQSSYHIQVRSEIIGELIKKAHDLNVCLIEIHSHVDQKKAEFSWSDWSGFDDFVPHIFWRLPDRPYAALVFTEKTFDGLYWNEDPLKYLPIHKITDGNVTLESTGLSKKPIEHHGY